MDIRDLNGQEITFYEKQITKNKSKELKKYQIEKAISYILKWND